MANNDAGGSQFDPRFDPAFQPGYDPSRSSVPSTTQSAPRREPQRQSQQQVDAYAPSDSPAAAQVAKPPAPAPAAPEPSRGPVVVQGPVAPSVTSDAVTRRRVSNPLIVALWVLSAVFVAAGVYGLRLIGDRVTQLGANGGFGGADYYLLQSYTFGAPLLIVLGLATATGTLFLLAARWKRSA